MTKTQRIPQQSLPFINAIGKEIYPGAPLSSDIKGPPIQYISCQDFGNEQALFIVNEIKRLINQGLAKVDEIACLGRTRRMLSDLSILLVDKGVDVIESYRKPTSVHLMGIRNLCRMVSVLKQCRHSTTLADTLPPGTSNQDQRRLVGLAVLYVDQSRQPPPAINPHLRPFVGLVSFVGRGWPPFLFGIDPRPAGYR